MLAIESAGATAIVTAAGGVAVSLGSVWANSRKQAAATALAEGRLQTEVDLLRSEVDSLRRQLEQAEQARIDRDRLLELCQSYGGRRLRRRLLDIDLRR